jgi:hypothetical protein
LGEPPGDLAHSCIAWHLRPEEYCSILGPNYKALRIPDEAEYTAAEMQAIEGSSALIKS